MIHTTIIGLGLIGGSLGLALKKFGGVDWYITGYSRRQETTNEALKQGAIDRTGSNLQEAAGKADLVVLATPIRAIPDVMTEIAPYLKRDCVVSDTASTKEQVLKWASSILPPDVSFVGGHPMAGKETWGLEVAEPDLFKGATYCIVSSPSSTTRAIELMTKMVETIKAKPLSLSAEEHDRLVGGISHLPLVLSAMLVYVTQKDPAWPQMARLAAGGYRDTTRVASGNPQMGRDICLTNHRVLITWIDRLMAELSRFKEMLGREDAGAIESTLSAAKEGRDSWLKQRLSSGG